MSKWANYPGTNLPAHRAQAEPAPSGPAPQALKDTGTAARAMRTAYSFTEEVLSHNHFYKANETLALAAQQLQIAHNADPTATITIDTDDGHPYTHTLSSLRSLVLYLQGLAHQAHGRNQDAITALNQAFAVDPDDPRPLHALGILYTEEYRKEEAVDALSRALALDPDDIEIHKALARAQTLSRPEKVYKKTKVNIGENINSAARVIKYWWWIIPYAMIVIGIAEFHGGLAFAFVVATVGWAGLVILKREWWDHL